MKTKKIVVMLLAMAVTVCLTHGISHAERLKIGIMQDMYGAVEQYRPLRIYLRTKGIDLELVPTYSYAAAAKMFVRAKVDAMFSGSGIAGTMIIKKVANPIVRPLSKDGNSSYWAVILAPKGSAKFTNSADYFRGKKVVFCGMASAGEIYFHAIGGHKTASEMIQATSHEAAIVALSKGEADVAIVKNRIWDQFKNDYPELEIIGDDTGENPDGTLIVSKIMDSELSEKVTSVMLSLMEDNSPEAKKLKDAMNISGFIKTTEDDFSHTLELLKKAGVNRKFNFEF
ncbi:MAG: hypothetical protein AMK71_00665 [Nitrospira bacterium SG8_35_4]|nr:MAG: hypothetical protein AMK71_00665 [Nitrospira bacterium SG8_35_4]